MITIILSIFCIFFYAIGLFVFSGIYCGFQVRSFKELLICIFYPITIFFVR